MSDFCQVVNSVLAWRGALADNITDRDYVDFTVPRTTEEMANIVLAVNDTFASVGADMRVNHENGVIIPTVR